MIIDIFFIVIVILMARIGWITGFSRTFFAVLAGFLAIFAANKYPPYQAYFYLIFIGTTLFVIALGAFIVRLIRFFYLGILDKIGGVVLSVCVWLIVSVNIIIPMTSQRTRLANGACHGINVISNIFESRLKIFKDYIPQFEDFSITKVK